VRGASLRVVSVARAILSVNSVTAVAVVFMPEGEGHGGGGVHAAMAEESVLAWLAKVVSRLLQDPEHLVRVHLPAGRLDDQRRGPGHVWAREARALGGSNVDVRAIGEKVVVGGEDIVLEVGRGGDPEVVGQLAGFHQAEVGIPAGGREADVR